FGPDLQRRVLPIFHYALKPYGFLVLGSAESVGGLNELFTQVDTKQRVFIKTSPLSRGGAPVQLHGPQAQQMPPTPERHRSRAIEHAAHEPMVPGIEKI